ncbi:MAG: GNAT family N-acetyltransferase [Anaerolineaceae bacterium]|nr:GNAT family N-acetyltransferase [Anaerolineaceae bacterium]
MTHMIDIQSDSFPTLQTERLQISALTFDDIKRFYAYRTHPDIARYQGSFPESEEQVEQLIHNQSRVAFGKLNQWFQFAIRLQTEQTLLGDIGLRFVSPFIPQIEIGYSISVEYQRQGYGKESVKAVLDHCFSNLNLQVISAIIDVRNTASQRMLESLGFQRMAFRPHACFLRDEWCDEADYALFADQWQNQQI